MRSGETLAVLSKPPVPAILGADSYARRTENLFLVSLI
jgi:hypothetical protein